MAYPRPSADAPAEQMLPGVDWRAELEATRPGTHTLRGLVRRIRLPAPQLDTIRDLYIALPPDYLTSARRYPVLYMHDGQNLFDAQTSYAGEWQADETLDLLGHEGQAAIIVGIANGETRRIDEYSPFHDQRVGGGAGDAYLAFLVDTVKPFVDGALRTLPDREHTGILGSSMGGLISLYAFFARPQVFGFAGAMSPSLWFAGGALEHYIGTQPFQPGRLYLDAGTEEMPLSRAEQLLLRTSTAQRMQRFRSMQALLIDKGYTHGQLLTYLEEAGGQHHEAAWARRLPDALRFLLPQR